MKIIVPIYKVLQYIDMQKLEINYVTSLFITESPRISLRKTSFFILFPMKPRGIKTYKDKLLSRNNLIHEVESSCLKSSMKKNKKMLSLSTHSPGHSWYMRGIFLPQYSFNFVNFYNRDLVNCINLHQINAESLPVEAFIIFQ